MSTHKPTYRIEVKHEGRWQPAPGESTGWEREAAEAALQAGIPTMDGSPADWEGVRIVEEVPRCESGEWSGVRCEQASTVVVEWMPVYLRASHEAAGSDGLNGCGVYPANGSIRLHVCSACAEAMQETDGEWCREVQP